jgi:hypothetical protein
MRIFTVSVLPIAQSIEHMIHHAFQGTEKHCRMEKHLLTNDVYLSRIYMVRPHSYQQINSGTHLRPTLH